MILAAAAYAEGKGPLPLPLRYAFQARKYNALPESGGGLRDQPVALLTQMDAMYNVYTAFYEFLHRQPGWEKDHPEKWEIVKEIYRRRNGTK